MKNITVIIWLGLLSGAVCLTFWHNEWKFNLPTPVPANYKTVGTGTSLALPAAIKAEKDKPLFLHFFNPRCPCSKFNIRHFKSLVNQYGSQVDFKIVVLSNNKYSAEEIQQTFGIALPVLFDASIAGICGVYSTPQAVLVTADQRLFFRGNYNKSRYCSDKQTEYARMALDAFFNNTASFNAGTNASTAYGCQLPKCN